MTSQPDGSVTRGIGDLIAGADPDAQELWRRDFHRLVHLARDRLRAGPHGPADAEDAALDTDREIRTSCDRQGRATRPVVDPRVFCPSAFLKAFLPLSRSTEAPSRQGSGSPFRSSGGAPLPD